MTEETDWDYKENMFIKPCACRNECGNHILFMKGGMTHLLRLGSFQIEVVPSRDIEIEKIFKEIIADLYEKFGEEVLKINTADIIAKKQADMGSMHG